MNAQHRRPRERATSFASSQSTTCHTRAVSAARPRRVICTGCSYDLTPPLIGIRIAAALVKWPARVQYQLSLLRLMSMSSGLERLMLTSHRPRRPDDQSSAVKHRALTHTRPTVISTVGLFVCPLYINKTKLILKDIKDIKDELMFVCNFTQYYIDYSYN